MSVDEDTTNDATTSPPAPLPAPEDLGTLPASVMINEGKAETGNREPQQSRRADDVAP